jgi:Spy/CpxP family protein refolding chaperone
MQRGWKTAALALIAAVTVTSTAFAQRQGRGFGGGGAQLLQMPEVQGELKLTDDQKTKVTSMLEQLRSQRQGQQGQFRDLSPEDRQKLMAERTAKENALVGAILDADQMKRYHQLVLQQQGARAFQDKSVADKLSLTADQQDKIQGLLRESAEAMRELRQAGDPQATREKVAALNKDTNEKVMAVLTDAQKSQWKEMLGTPVTFPLAQGFGFGRRRNNNNN